MGMGYASRALHEDPSRHDSAGARLHSDRQGGRLLRETAPDEQARKSPRELREIQANHAESALNSEGQSGERKEPQNPVVGALRLLSDDSGAGGGTRTLTPVRTWDFKSHASAGSATPAPVA